MIIILERPNRECENLKITKKDNDLTLNIVFSDFPAIEQDNENESEKETLIDA